MVPTEPDHGHRPDSAEPPVPISAANRSSDEAAKSLQLSEDRLRAVLSSFDDLVFELDDDGAYLGIWTTDESLLAAPRSALLGRTMHDAIGDTAGSEVSRAIAMALETGHPQLCEYSLEVPAGTRWFQGRVAIIGGSSEPERVCLVVRDITVLKAAQEEVSRNVERLELMHVVDRAVLERLSLSDLATVTLRKLREITRADRASIIIVDTATEGARFLAVEPPDAPGPLDLARLSDLMPFARDADREVHRYADMAAIPDPPPIIRHMCDAGVRSLMSASIVDGGVAVGLLSIWSMKVSGIDPSCDQVLREMADQLAVGLRQWRLIEAAETHARELEDAISALRRADSARLELLSRLVSAQEEERRRIASDLHDDPIQKVTAASMRLDMLAMAHPQLADDETFVKAKATVASAIESMRHLMTELRPYVLDRDGLGSALRLVLEEGFGPGQETTYELSDRLESQPAEIDRVVLFRIAQEALMNVRKHARASRARVELVEAEDGYRVRVSDDGVGFVTAKACDSPRGHLGLTSMRQRAELVGGTCTIESALGRGTVVETWIPSSRPTQPFR
ncbi:MAG: ATP-binding protein [Acidimicrobiales bacterium]|jgi:PAS domain S-box-containing protein